MEEFVNHMRDRKSKI